MTKFKLNMLTVALATVGLSSYSIAAQETLADAEQRESPAEAREKAKAAASVEVIEIKGFRRSVAESINTKQYSNSIVDSVSAEDIGKLPDSSIAESIARLPGLSAQRLDGRASLISVRGMGGDFNTTTFNGREQVSIGDNRGVEFDLYPSEVISEVVVYKTPDASLITQGIGGTVDLRSVRPLDKSERIINANVRFEKNGLEAVNPDMDDQGKRGSIGYINQFNDGKVGVALAYAHMQSPNQEERWHAWNYDRNEDGIRRLGGAKPYVRSSELTRDSVLGVLEFAPNKDLHLTFDAMYVDFEDKQILRGVELPIGYGRDDGSSTIDILEERDGVATRFRANDVKGIVRNDVNFRQAELTSFGANVEYQLSDWTLEADLSYSKADRKLWVMESYATTGRGGNAGQGVGDDIIVEMNDSLTGATFTPSLDYSDRALFELGAARNWGVGEVGVDGQDGNLLTPETKDEMTTFKLAANRLLENDFFSSVEVGVNYSKREKSKVDYGEYLRVPNYVAGDVNSTLPIADKYYLGNVSLGYLGMGNMIAYDSLAMYHDGVYDSVVQGDTVPDKWRGTWTVFEDIYTTYVKADISSYVFDLPLYGNVGVQYVYTDQSSDGFQVSSRPEGGLNIDPTTQGDSYSNVLPSLNLVLKVTDEQQLRFGAARTVARPRMDQMNSSFSYGFDRGRNNPGVFNPDDLTTSPWSSGSGNPSLKPIVADQFDLSYEYYYTSEGYVAAAVFHKDIKDWVANNDTIFDFSDFNTPNPEDVPITNLGVNTIPDNVGDAKVSGAELTAVVPFNVLTEALDGFGAVLSATFLDSEVDVKGMQQEIPGLSDKVYNFTVYYEKAGFQFRTSMNYRSEYQGAVRNQTANLDTRTAAAETLWDAQLGYDFSESSIDALKGLSVTFQVQNITDEPFVTNFVDGETGQVIGAQDYQRYGRNFMLGFGYKF
ncbi:TonB-dependent receptor [Rheinheimera sp. EpRS3]|uniref:TonB-dependent receptor n=1 Tax=Rheinheimera sp. EpRS3 TaxID=1712383 RepID=UPI000ADEB2FF|nr:TonB-dependent receptor [Rheinheimera sp. EpRS3]